VRHVVIPSHPSPASLNTAIANTHATVTRSLGEEVEVRDLHAEAFDQRLLASELPWNPTFSLATNIEA